MTAVSFKCWTPAVPFKKSDNIISSEFTTLKMFTPSYEKEPHISMNQLIANEYQRIWITERDEWARKTFVLKNGKTYIKKSSKISQKGNEDGKSDRKLSESQKQTKSAKQPGKK